MPRFSRLFTGRPRAYTLIAVLLLAIIVSVGAASIIFSNREGTFTSLVDKRDGEAYACAVAGLSWAMGTLHDATGTTALASASGGTTRAAYGVNIHKWDANDPYAGIGTAPPARGVSNSDWIAYGDRGHYGLTAFTSPLEEG